MFAEADIRDLWPGQGSLFGVPWPREEQDLVECKKVEEMKIPCLFLKNEWRCVTIINEQIGVLMEEQKGCSNAFNQVLSERRKSI